MKESKKSTQLKTENCQQKTRLINEALVAEVRADFAARSAARRETEAQWQLNANFLLGNQYCYLNIGGTLEDADKDYFWQERGVYNHIAPIYKRGSQNSGACAPK